MTEHRIVALIVLTLAIMGLLTRNLPQAIAIWACCILILNWMIELSDMKERHGKNVAHSLQGSKRPVLVERSGMDEPERG
jgi:hypothetical protein